MDYEQLPKVESARISFIKVFTLPDLFLNPGSIKPEFTFLSSLQNYVQYYLDYEKPWSGNGKKYPLTKVPKLGYLRPLSRRHTMNSFWKSYRLQYQKETLRGIDSSGLFLFLPLVVKIPINNLTAMGKEFKARIILYVFPFGVCTVNMDVRIENESISFDKFIDLIEYIRSRSIIKREELSGKFEDIAKILANQVSNSITGGTRIPIPFSTHTMIYIKKTSERLFFDTNVQNLRNHLLGIAALLSKDKNVASQPRESVDEILSCKLKEKRTEEILLFKPARAVLYPSNSWIEEMTHNIRQRYSDMDLGNEAIEMAVKYRIDRSLQCMCDNYQSFLNVLFATNRFIQDCLIPNRQSITDSRINAFYKPLSQVFPTSDTSTGYYYYPHAIREIGKIIHMHESIEGIKPA